MKTKVLNNGAQWDSQSHATLRELVSKGLSIKKIAKIMGRTPNAITYQKCVMGLYSPNGPKSKKVIKSSFNTLSDLLNKLGASNSITKDKVSKISRIEWTKEKLAALKSLGDGGTLRNAPKILGCTENAARIKYNRFFKKAYVRVRSSETPKTGVTPVAPVAPVSNTSNVTREQAKDMARSAREIARANGKRITMAMFFVEDL